MKKQYSEMTNGEKVDYYLSLASKMNRMKSPSQAADAIRQAEYFLTLPGNEIEGDR